MEYSLNSVEALESETYRDSWEDLSDTVPEIPVSSAANDRGECRLTKAERDALVLQYLPMAKASARKSRLDWEDAEQEAILGLIRAAERFDKNAQVAFSTYAHYWVAEALQKAAIRDMVVHVPLHVAKKQHAEYKKTDLDPAAATKKSKQEPSNRAWGSTPSAMVNAHPSRVEMYTEDGFCRIDSAHHQIHRHDIRIDYKIVQTYIHRLTEKQKAAISLYYSDETITLEKIGKIMGVSRESVRQLIERGMEKLRAIMGVDITS